MPDPTDPADRRDPAIAPDLAGELQSLLAAIEREPVPERLLAAAMALQAALRARTASGLTPSRTRGPDDAATPPAAPPSPE